MNEQAKQAAPSEDAHLDALESESVHIIHEACAMLDTASSVLVRLCRKAFFGPLTSPVESDASTIEEIIAEFAATGVAERPA